MWKICHIWDKIKLEGEYILWTVEVKKEESRLLKITM